MTEGPYRRGAVLAGVALAVFAARCVWVARAASEVPVWDQWFAEFGRVYAPLVNKDLALTAMAWEHNEHRMLTTRLISMLLFLASGYWDVRGEIVVSAATRGAEMALLTMILAPLVTPARRIGLVVLVLAVGGLPISPFNLMSGFQVQFPLVEVFAIAMLALVVRPLDVERVCGVVVCALLAFFSMATGVLAMAAAATTVLAQGLAARSLPRSRAAVAGLLVWLAAFCLLLTPLYPGYASPSRLESARILVQSLSFPFPAVSAWALVGHLPVAILAARMFRAGVPHDPGWSVLALAAWTLLQSASLAIGRGAMGAPLEQHLELLSLPLIWNYVALARIVDAAPRAGSVARAARIAPTLWAALACVALSAHAWVRGVPPLRAMEATGPVVEARFRESLRAHDFRRELAEAVRAEASVRARDASFLYDPTGRYTIPQFALPSLASLERPKARLFPPALSGVGSPAPVARLLRGTAAAWPIVLTLALGLLVAGLRAEVRGERRGG